MTYKLKDFFDAAVVRSIATDFRRVHTRFDERAFVKDCLDGLGDLELTQRGWHVAETLHRHLPQPFPKAAKVLIASLGPELDGDSELGMGPFRYMPHAFFVSKYGLDHFDDSMSVLYEITKRFTAEFSIRAFLVKHPEATHRQLRAWAADPNVHVRRLVSEGTRPRLPWAPRLRAFQEDPSPVIELLELLKDDPERYVQRSVANNINDIGKDHPNVAIALCRRWLTDASPGRAWIVKHALRSLVKKADADALEALGFAATPKIKLVEVRLDRSVKLGDSFRFSLALVSTSKRAQDLLVDYAIHFVKGNGATRPKVFKLRKLTLDPSGTIELSGKVSFAKMTTRRHNPGRHRIDLIVNGVSHPLGEFLVRQ